MGTNGGRGGSQHISIDKRFYSNGIQGSLVPIGAGAALANKLNNKKKYLSNIYRRRNIWKRSSI